MKFTDKVLTTFTLTLQINIYLYTFASLFTCTLAAVQSGGNAVYQVKLDKLSKVWMIMWVYHKRGYYKYTNYGIWTDDNFEIAFYFFWDFMINKIFFDLRVSLSERKKDSEFS